MKNSKPIENLVTLVLLAICVALAVAVITEMKAPAETLQVTEGESSSAVNVGTKVVAYEPFERVTHINGEVSADGSDITILPDTAGTVTAVYVRRGDIVEPGDVVAMIDASIPGSRYMASPVTAKVGGEISDVSVTVGQKITTSTVVATIVSDKTLYVEANIPEKYMGTLKNGMTATFTSVAYPDRTYTGVVRYISPTVSPTNRSVAIELELDGDITDLKEGMYVSINLVTEQVESAITVPTTAIVSYIDSSIVYVVNNNIATRRVVTTGSNNDTDTIITSGLELGDVVVVEGTVADGTAVNIVY